MRIPSASTDRILYFVAVDSTDYVTRKTGLSAFTVYRSRNGGTATVYTTPTIAELSSSNMPGVYGLTVDEDTTIGATHDTEEMCVHITCSTMAPVSRVVELYRPETTEGQTLTVSGGIENPVRASTAQAGSNNTITLDASASATNNLYNGEVIQIVGSTGAGQVRTIIGYNGTTKIATIDRNWTTNPSSSSTFAILPQNAPRLNANLQVQSSGSTAVIRSGTAQTGSTSNTIKLDSGASATNNIYNRDVITITGGTGVGQTRSILAYNGTTKVATVDSAWVTTPDNTSTFDILASLNPSLYSDQGVAQAGASGTITLASTASATNSVYVGSLVTLLAGTGSGQTREITAYNGSTKVATVDTNWSTPPDSTSSYGVIPSAASSGPLSIGIVDANVVEVLGLPATVLTTGDIADGIIGRNIAGGSDGGRIVGDVFAFLRNKVSFPATTGGTMTVYATDDSTPQWTAVVTLATRNPATVIDPA